MVIEDEDIVYFEKKYSPQAILDYTKYRSRNKVAGRMKGDSDLTSRVRMHLAYVGWSFYYQKRKGDMKELHYKAPGPDGRKFNSLVSACEWYESKGCIQIHDHDLDSNNDDPVSVDDITIIIEKNHGSNETKKRKHVEDGPSVFLQPASKKPRKAAPSKVSKLIDENLALPGATVYYRDRKDGYPVKQGTISREGVTCCCCRQVFSLTKFEAHAGRTPHNPSGHVFLQDGRSIQECLNGEKRAESYQGKESDLDLHPEPDYLCSVCRGEGDLLRCDQCPSAFHTKCLGLHHIPQGQWFCPSCCCSICNLVSVKQYKEQKPGDKNIYLQCGQCEHRYHTECLRRRGHIFLEYQLEGNWFCNSRCKSIHIGLKNLTGKVNQVGHDNLTWTLLKCKDSKPPDNGKLEVALEILHECFDPVIEGRNARDVLKDAVFNKCADLHRLNFEGFYTVVLGRKDEIFTAALMRVFGEKVAEIPFVGTRSKYRKLGMCRILMNEIEKKLREFGVESLVLPASGTVVETWENRFGFSRMNESEKLSYADCRFLDFPDTIMCQKMFRNFPPPDLGEDEEISI